jgi:hypothetical protein
LKLCGVNIRHHHGHHQLCIQCGCANGICAWRDSKLTHAQVQALAPGAIIRPPMFVAAQRSQAEQFVGRGGCIVMCTIPAGCSNAARAAAAMFGMQRLEYAAPYAKLSAYVHLSLHDVASISKHDYNDHPRPFSTNSRACFSGIPAMRTSSHGHP